MPKFSPHPNPLPQAGEGTRKESLEDLLSRIRACRHCAHAFSHEPRPTLRVDPHARLLIVGQAPGSKVHATGIPWNDRSGDRLRDWLGLERTRFYDEKNIAIVPMGFCYPGVDAYGGDLPPRKECAPKWHGDVMQALPNLKLTLLVGSYAQRYYLKTKAPMTEVVREWRAALPRFLPLPHPSWRNTAWLRKNPWFDEEVVPYLRKRVRAVLKS
jgi:uracil-DNA glycosylase